MLKICRGDPVETFTNFLTLFSKSSQGTSRTVVGVVGVNGSATTLSLWGLFGVPLLGLSGTSSAGQCRFVGAVKDTKNTHVATEPVFVAAVLPSVRAQQVA